MNRLALGALALVVAVVGAVVVYLTVIREDAPPEFGLTETTSDSDESSEDSADEDGGTEDTDAYTEDADTEDADAEEADTEEADAEDADADETADAGSEETADSGAVELDGTWTVGDGSQAGYRVVEDLQGITDFEAVGRTSDVSGSVVVSGTTVSEGSFEVQIATITSDDSRRDGQFTGDIMNAAEFPTATLTLTEPIELDGIPGDGATVSTTATGELTLRDSTNPVTFPVDAQILDGRIEIVASIDVLFSDYGIANPSNPFVTVRDEGKVEVQLFLDKS